MQMALRAVVLITFVAAGLIIGAQASQQALGGAAGLALGILAMILENILKKVPLASILAALLGLALGLAAARLFLVPLEGVLGQWKTAAFFALGALLGYGGMLIGFRKGEKIGLGAILRTVKGQEPSESIKLLDTSVIIDGRIADICETGFLEGEFVVPQFILHELQYIADSPDSLKRARGRRGLDVLQKIQKMHQINVRIVEEDFPKIKDVDAKLVALGKAMGAKVITNDFNLNKVSELQGVAVLNINELANAIKPVVLPGETIRVFIIKEGKEHNQGVAYLDDGTMVVVDNGRRLIGKNVDVTVTSVLQTTAGRMIFTKTKEEYDKEETKVQR